MNNKDVAVLLRNVAATYSIKDEKKFRFQIIAYERAADAVEHYTQDLHELWKKGQLTDIPGVGPSIASHLDDLFKKGHVPYFDKLMENIPQTTFELFEIPGMGPKKAFKLINAFNIRSPGTAVAEIEKAAKNHEIAALEGFGDKSEEDILKSITQYKKGTIKENRMNLPIADGLAKDALSYLRSFPKVIQAEALGSLRRMSPTIGDIDLAVASDYPGEVLDYFIKYPKAERVIERGDVSASLILFNGRQLDLMIQPPKGFGALLQHFTGSKGHNIKLREYALSKGLSLSEYGVKATEKTQNLKLKAQSYNSKLKTYQFSTEEGFYDAIGLPLIPPELREDKGEIEAAINTSLGKTPGLPKLIDLSDIKGDLHIHSNYNLKPSHDLGVSSLEEIIKIAGDLNYEYIGISDHNPSISKHDAKQVYEIVKRRNTYIEKYNYPWKTSSENRGIYLFNSLEVDILSDGSLAVEDKSLELLDFCIASVHSSFNLTPEEMTKRILQGLDHPKVKIFGHPTGRLLGQRESYEADWDKIFDYCKKRGIALEINAYPTRLDLPDVLVKEAVKNGVKLMIDTDSHVADQMNLMSYGVSVARRGWCTASDIINTMGYNDFNRWLKS